MAKTTGYGRIALQLDPRVALEALVLNRLERIPAPRRQEWLRGLLIQGFRYECQTLRVVRDEPHPQSVGPQQRQGVSGNQPRSLFAAWLVKSMPSSGTPTQPTVVAAGASVKGHQAKPFAGLRKVIG
ncbi:hypothetical protein [Sedimenticola selenatireducens]|uniref:Uncharacterized protein n=1 Tax=Sedimenticola selenatireducens TaxID=191960 RepID=A0A2N6CV49_9GAMM|nr:hypothetical protein [Sedimenticola selenatireducens]PLX61077.1 MAG: hypothetical protein C0630_11740 [Sedimenticola selenatireducens]